MLLKKVKVKSKSTVKNYKENYNYCEACCKLDGIYPVNTNLELHHINHSAGRTDEIWNIITLCNKHHRMATWHSDIGQDSYEWNSIYIAIKYIKKEINDNIIEIFFNKYKDDIQFYVNQIINSSKYKTGKLLGWYNA